MLPFCPSPETDRHKQRARRGENFKRRQLFFPRCSKLKTEAARAPYLVEPVGPRKGRKRATSFTFSGGRVYTPLPCSLWACRSRAGGAMNERRIRDRYRIGLLGGTHGRFSVAVSRWPPLPTPYCGEQSREERTPCPWALPIVGRAPECVRCLVRHPGDTWAAKTKRPPHAAKATVSEINRGCSARFFPHRAYQIPQPVSAAFFWAPNLCLARYALFRRSDRWEANKRARSVCTRQCFFLAFLSSSSLIYSSVLSRARRQSCAHVLHVSPLGDEHARARQRSNRWVLTQTCKWQEDRLLVIAASITADHCRFKRFLWDRDSAISEAHVARY